MKPRLLLKSRGVYLKKGEKCVCTCPTKEIFAKILQLFMEAGYWTTVKVDRWDHFKKNSTISINFSMPKITYGEFNENSDTNYIDGYYFIYLNTGEVLRPVSIDVLLYKLENKIKEKENEAIIPKQE